jgi:hypothetical protein
MQHRLGAQGGNALGQRRAAHQMHGMVGVVAVMHLPADDLAAVQVEDQVQVEPAPHDVGRQVGHVPAPDLARGGGDVRGRRPDRLGCLGAATAGVLPMRAQHTAEAGFAGQVDALVGQHGHDARRRHGGKARLIGHGQHLRALGLSSGHGWGQGARPAACHRPPTGRPSAFQRCRVRKSMPAISQAGFSRAPAPCNMDVSGQGLAIFEADHSSSPLLKIAATFFDSTSSAAVSASARSLRSRSRSSSLIRLRSAAWPAGWRAPPRARPRPWCSWRATCPVRPDRRRAHGTRRSWPASSIAAVVITASSRAPAVQARPRAGLDCASSRQRSSVPHRCPNLLCHHLHGRSPAAATAPPPLSLNASPYRAISHPSSPPRFNIYGGDNYSDAGGDFSKTGAD